MPPSLTPTLSPLSSPPDSVSFAAAAAAAAASGSNTIGEVEAARLNVLVNAAQAVGRGGRAVSLDVKVLQLLGQVRGRRGRRGVGSGGPLQVEAAEAGRKCMGWG